MQSTTQESRKAKKAVKSKARMLGNRTLGAIATILTPKQANKRQAKCMKASKKAKGIVTKQQAPVKLKVKKARWQNTRMCAANEAKGKERNDTTIK